MSRQQAGQVAPTPGAAARSSALAGLNNLNRLVAEPAPEVGHRLAELQALRSRLRERGTDLERPREFPGEAWAVRLQSSILSDRTRALIEELLELEQQLEALKKAIGHGALKQREPLPQTAPFDQRSWDEGVVLRALGGWQKVPAALAGGSLHSFLPGRVLATVRNGATLYRYEIAAVLADLLRVPVRLRFPEPYDGWPEEGRGREYLLRRARYAELRVARVLGGHPVYGPVLEGLGVPADLMTRFARALPELTSRPFGLLHGDLHPGNLIVGGLGRLQIVDWELAGYGDPLHDVAIHLERTAYPGPADEARMVGAWRAMVSREDPAHAAGLESDLPWFRRFEAVRSVYPDVVRAIELPGIPRELREERLRAAVVRAFGALGDAELKPPNSGRAAEVLAAAMESNHRAGTHF